MERLYLVYIHTNKINNKKYIGITCQKTTERWNNGKGYSAQHFARAIKKYGWDAFEHKIVKDNLSAKEAKQLEKELIKQYETRNPEKGYNITLGGDGYTLYETEEERLEARRRTKDKVISKRNSDPTRREVYLQQLKKHKQLRKADPIKHQKDLEANRRCHKVQRSTEAGRQKDKEARLKIKAEIKQIRLELKDLFIKYPERFSIEDYNTAFGRRQTPNGSWRYIVESNKTRLNLLLQKVKGGN